LAGLLTLPALVAAGDSVLKLGVSVDELARVVVHTPDRRHVRRAKRAIELVDVRSESRPESHMRVAVSCADLPTFAVNEPVFRSTGGWLATPDLSLPEARLALEYQGLDHADPRRMRRDLTRAADLRSDGWQVLAYGPAEVFGRPWQIEHEVRDAVLRRVADSAPSGQQKRAHSA
jgi:hypothetical protein